MGLGRVGCAQLFYSVPSCSAPGHARKVILLRWDWRFIPIPPSVPPCRPGKAPLLRSFALSVINDQLPWAFPFAVQGCAVFRRRWCSDGPLGHSVGFCPGRRHLPFLPHFLFMEPRPCVSSVVCFPPNVSSRKGCPEAGLANSLQGFHAPTCQVSQRPHPASQESILHWTLCLPWSCHGYSRLSDTLPLGCLGPVPRPMPHLLT